MLTAVKSGPELPINIAATQSANPDDAGLTGGHLL